MSIKFVRAMDGITRNTSTCANSPRPNAKPANTTADYGETDDPSNLGNTVTSTVNRVGSRGDGDRDSPAFEANDCNATLADFGERFFLRPSRLDPLQFCRARVRRAASRITPSKVWKSTGLMK